VHGSNGAPVANCFGIESLSPPSALTRGVALLGLLDRRLGQDTAPMSRRIEPCRALMAALRLDMSGISLNQVDIVAFEASIRNLFELRANLRNLLSSLVHSLIRSVNVAN